jgi:UDP-3-O-[3-hydroxymyristoyl] glucosamine N-acyltransferase
MPSRTPRGATATPHTLSDIARALGADLVGDGTLVVTTVAHPLLAESSDTLALATEEKAEQALAHTKAVSAVVAPGREAALTPLKGGIVVSRPRYAMAQLLELFAQPPVTDPGVHPSAIVHPTATIGAGVSIGPCCYIGPGAQIGFRSRVLPHATIGADVTVGEDCQIHAGVRIGDRCVLGHRVILHPNVVIGSDGFGFVTPEKGSVESAKETGRVESTNVALVRVHSIGIVVIDDDVEIGAATCVDRATLGVTRIGRGTKIDNLVQIGHNCTIGENCLIAGMCGLSGSVTLGDRVTMGGGVGVTDHVSIGDDAIIVARSGVATSVPPRQVWGGFMAVPWQDATQQLFGARRVPRLLREIDDLKQRLTRLEREKSPSD